MKLYELFEIINESETLWVNDGSESPVLYDGKNNIDERFNNLEVKLITVGGDGFLTVELESLEDRLNECIDNMDEYELKEMWNTYCHSYGYSEQHIYAMDEFDDYFHGWSAKDVADMAVDGNYSSWADWFTYDDGINCTCNLDELVETDDLVACILEEHTSLGNSEVKDIIGEW